MVKYDMMAFPNANALRALALENGKPKSKDNLAF